MNSGGLGDMSAMYFPLCSTAIKLLNVMILWVYKGRMYVYRASFLLGTLI